MSTNEPGSAPNAATLQDGQEESDTVAQRVEAGAYQAPYYAYESPVQGVFLVAFRPGYTLAAHFAFLSYDLELRNRFESGYCAVLDKQTFDTIRRDPGVEYIEDNTFGELE